MYRGRFGILAALRRALAPPPPATTAAAPSQPPAAPPVVVALPEPAPPDPVSLPEPAPPPAPAKPDPDAALEAADRRIFARTAYRRILRREPSKDELAHWTQAVAHMGHAKLLERFFGSDEYLTRRRVEDRAPYPGGHYYSPIVDPEGLWESGFRVDRALDADAIADIDLRPDAQVALWRRHLPDMLAAPFPTDETPGRRYYSRNGAFAWGDSLILLAMFEQFRPKRVLEIGSGYSSACMLDICDDRGFDTRFTFVDPNPERLHGLLSDQDRERCEILPILVQQLEPTAWQALEADDILFIDSTHVSKAGSDVNFELFQMLPGLKPGVVVHIHDMFWPFEYPEAWTFEARRSWNELYLVRAFLMGNRDFEVVFFNDYFAARHPEETEAAPEFRFNPGGGLWLRKLA